MPAKRSTDQEVTRGAVETANEMSEAQAEANLNVHRAEDRPPVDPVVLTIQSHVAYGHVGNDAAIFPLQVAGIEVVDIPTTMLSNHPGYPTMRGEFVQPRLIRDLLQGLTERNLPAFAAGVITGYLGDPGTADAVRDWVRESKATNPALRYLCDPVMGDTPGIYVDPALPQKFRDELVPLADAITPNQFEFGVLTGTEVTTREGLLAAAAELVESGIGVVVVTGTRLEDTPDDSLDIYGVTADGAWRVRTPRLDFTPVGTGDVYTALFAAHWFQGAAIPDALTAAAGGTYAVLTITGAANVPEMRLVASAGKLLHPDETFPAERVR
ncbi:MAG TPA: pyridoxal kinase [Thermomicrobiales bacterium]|jgi:pyridoxine kinase|nr:pyridoxal kinase [Thermomicrobiales bacterium]